MNYARRILLAAAPLLGCGGAPGDMTGDGSSGGPAGSSSSGASEPTSGGSSSGESSTSGEPTSGGSSSGGSSSGEPSSGESSSDGPSTGGESSTGEATSTGEVSEQAPDFALIDVNPNSATFEKAVSPRDYLEKTSGWYFTHAT